MFRSKSALNVSTAVLKGSNTTQEPIDNEIDSQSIGSPDLLNTIEPYSPSELTQQIQNELINTILNNKEYENTMEPGKAQSTVSNLIATAWNNNLAILSFALTDVPTAILRHREGPSKAMLSTGKSILKNDLSPCANVAFFSDYGANNKSQNAIGYLDGEEKIFNHSNATIYIPVHYITEEKTHFTGKLLSSALNYFMGKNKWNVVIYLEGDNNLQPNQDKKAAWLASNKDMLNGMQKKYGNKLSILDHAGLIRQDTYAKAEQLFLQLIGNAEIVTAIQAQVMQQLIMNNNFVKKHAPSANSSQLIARILIHGPRPTNREKKRVQFLLDGNESSGEANAEVEKSSYKSMFVTAAASRVVLERISLWLNSPNVLPIEKENILEYGAFYAMLPEMFKNLLHINLVLTSDNTFNTNDTNLLYDEIHRPQSPKVR